MIRARKILVVSKEPKRRQHLVKALGVAGYDTRAVRSLQGLISPDLALLDLVKGDLWPAVGLLASGRLILIVSNAAEMLRGFELGADDCVMTDADEEEIVARCEAVLRRTAQPDTAAEVAEPALYADSRLWINFGLRQVWVGGRSAQLTPREHRLLQYFIRNADQTLSHDDILAAVWARSAKSDRPTEVLKQYIWRLRQKVETDPDDPEIIVTALGEGYRFVSHLR